MNAHFAPLRGEVRRAEAVEHGLRDVPAHGVVAVSVRLAVGVWALDRGRLGEGVEAVGQHVVALALVAVHVHVDEPQFVDVLRVAAVMGLVLARVGVLDDLGVAAEATIDAVVAPQTGVVGLPLRVVR